ncbi:MAG: PfkB family carbohydrate kinase [Micrococcales bacterium]|nr:PfkB family carbohydrate kinase [Micrococcales bacterium]
MRDRCLVVGEALVDIVERGGAEPTEHVGGSPANVAMGLARLGHGTDLLCCLADDERGRVVADYVGTSGARLLPESMRASRTSTALARLDETGAATYEFDITWDIPAAEVGPETSHVHTGSIGAILPPGREAVLATLERAREHATITYDPNIRPSIIGPVDEALPLIERTIALTDVVKASDEDVALLYPGMPLRRVLAHLTSLGPRIAVITRGAEGVVYRVAATDETGEQRTLAERVVDTVGAGDSFMAGLVSGLLDAGLLGGLDARDRLIEATLADVTPAIERGSRCAATTVGHAGAYAPTRDEI